MEPVVGEVFLEGGLRPFGNVALDIGRRVFETPRREGLQALGGRGFRCEFVAVELGGERFRAEAPLAVHDGMAERCGYTSPADMVDKYPAFFWKAVEPYIGDALRYLELTSEGKQWIANLYSHVFTIEHQRRRLGPQHAAGDAGLVDGSVPAR